MTSRLTTSIFAGWLCAAAIAPAAAATTWWVDPVAGVDNGSCGPSGAPCKRLQFAVDRTSPGDTVRAKAGLYAEFVSLAGRQITLISDAFATSGDRSAAVIDCSGVCDVDSGLYIAPVYVGNGSTFTGFTVRDAGGTGIEGAGSVVITQNIVTGNAGLNTSRGGGISVYSTVTYPSTTPARVENNDVIANSAPELGGGIFIRAVSRADRGTRPVVVQNNIIRNNSTGLPKGRGGGIYVRAEGVNGGQTSIQITQNTIRGNTNTAGPDAIYYPWAGGVMAGLYGYGTHNLAITNNLIEQNTATVGAGVAILSSTNSTAVGVVSFSGNTVRTNNAIDPSATYGFGGGLFALASGLGTETLTVNNNTFSGNVARVFGGGVDARTSPGELGSLAVTVRNNLAVGNRTNEWGGGIFGLLDLTDTDPAAPGRLSILDNTVTSNSSDGVALATSEPVGRGGGIFAIASASRSTVPAAALVVRGNTVDSNRANLVGGGMNLSVTTSSLANPDDVTSVAAPAFATMTVDHNRVTNNLAASPDAATFPASGGGIFSYVSAIGQASSSLALDFSTVVSNASDIGSGGVEIESFTEVDDTTNTGVAAVTISNSVIAQNIGFGVGGPVPGDPGVITAGGTGDLSLDFFYNDVFANSDGEYESWISNPTGANGNISVAPALNASFGLTVCSPLIDAADPAADYSQEGQPNGGRANIGHQGGTASSVGGLADVNGDDIVDGIDVLRIATSFASTPSDPSRYLAAADLDANGIVDGFDLSYVGAGFGDTCP